MIQTLFIIIYIVHFAFQQIQTDGRTDWDDTELYMSIMYRYAFISDCTWDTSIVVLASLSCRVKSSFQ